MKTPLFEKFPFSTLRGAAPYLIAVLLALLIHNLIGPQMGRLEAKILTTVFISVVMAVSLNIVNGFTGQFSIGHAGFMAVGGYVAGYITYYGSVKIWGNALVQQEAFLQGQALFVFSLLMAGCAAAIFGYLVGLPSLRLRGDYLAIVTLGFGEIIRVFIQSTKPVIYNAERIKETSMLELTQYVGGSVGFDAIPKYNNLFWASLVAFITIIVAYRLKESIHGRAFLAIRENEIAAESMGVPTTKFKVKAFVLAAFFGGIGGGLFAHESGVLLNPAEMGFMKSFDYVIMVVLGGMGSISGSILAATVLTILPEVLRSAAEYRLIIYSILLILMMILRPQGIFGIREIWELRPFRKLYRRLRGVGLDG